MTLTISTLEQQLDAIKAQLPSEIANLIDKRDGPEQLIPILRQQYDPSPGNQETIWDATARAYSIQGRHFEALSIYYAMYEKLMHLQDKFGLRLHKGTPLVRISDAHRILGNTVLSKRYLMLTICEDAINWGGQIPAQTSGTYFRAVWQSGITAQEFKKYAATIWRLSLANSEPSRFPEWLLQELGQRWMQEYPSSGEAALWTVNRSYVQWLLAKLGGGDGLALERLAHYLLSTIQGFRARMHTRSDTTDYDIICAPEGLAYDFRSELGRYFLVECKDWNKPANVTAVNKFAAVLRSAKCRFGIIFSKKGITGHRRTKYAERELLKIFQQDGLAIVVFSELELKKIGAGDNFFTALRNKYERVRLDLPPSAFRQED